MSSPFQKAFSAKSPLGNHKKIQRKIDILRNKPGKAEKKGLSSESGGGVDYEAIEKLKAQLPEARASHNTSRTEEGDMQVRADEDAAQGSAVEMRSPLKKNSPLKGTYESPTGAPYVSHISSIQNAVGAVQGAIDSMMNESDENKAKRLQGRVDSRTKRLAHEDSIQKYTNEKGEEKVLKESDFYDNVKTASDEQKEKYAEAKSKSLYYDKDGVLMDHMNKTVDLQNRATAHQDAANVSASSEKDAQIKKLQEQIELLKGK